MCQGERKWIVGGMVETGGLARVGRMGAVALLVVLGGAAAQPARAKPPAPPPPRPACVSVSGPANFQCGGGGGAHIFLDKGKSVTETGAEYPKANAPENVRITFDGAADVANGFANIKPLKGGAMLTDITFVFTEPNNAVTGFLFRGQLNEHADPIVVTVTDQNNVQQVFDYYVDSKSNPADISALSFSQAIVGERVKSVSLSDAGGWYEGKQYEVTPCTGVSCPGGGFDPSIGGVAGVPEPASWSLMLIGAGGVGAHARRRRRDSQAGARGRA